MSKILVADQICDQHVLYWRLMPDDNQKINGCVAISDASQWIILIRGKWDKSLKISLQDAYCPSVNFEPAQLSKI